MNPLHLSEQLLWRSYSNSKGKKVKANAVQGDTLTQPTVKRGGYSKVLQKFAQECLWVDFWHRITLQKLYEGIEEIIFKGAHDSLWTTLPDDPVLGWKVYDDRFPGLSLPWDGGWAKYGVGMPYEPPTTGDITIGLGTPPGHDEYREES